jgi:hypothetical protein
LAGHRRDLPWEREVHLGYFGDIPNVVLETLSYTHGIKYEAYF